MSEKEEGRREREERGKKMRKKEVRKEKKKKKKNKKRKKMTKNLAKTGEIRPGPSGTINSSSPSNRKVPIFILNTNKQRK